MEAYITYLTFILNGEMAFFLLEQCMYSGVYQNRIGWCHVTSFTTLGMAVFYHQWMQELLKTNINDVYQTWKNSSHIHSDEDKKIPMLYITHRNIRETWKTSHCHTVNNAPSNEREIFTTEMCHNTEWEESWVLTNQRAHFALGLLKRLH